MSTLTAMAPSFTITSADDYQFGSASSGSEQPAAWMIHLVNNGATFSATVSAQSTAAPPDTAYLGIGYRALNLNGTAADGSLVADTAITDSSIIIVPCTGLNIALSVGTLTDGTVDVYLTPVYGPSVI